MEVYKVTVIGANTNTANRVVRYFSSRDAADDFVSTRQNDAPGTVVTVKRLKIRD